MPAEYVPLTPESSREQVIESIASDWAAPTWDEAVAGASAWLADHDAAIRAEGIAIGYRDGMKDGAAQTRAEVAREIRAEAERLTSDRPHAQGLLHAARLAEGTSE